MKTNSLGLFLAAAALLLFFGTYANAGCPVAHCWFISSGNTPTMQTSMSGCYAPLGSSTKINGLDYNYVTLPGVTVTSNNFGTYQISCDNGAGRTAQHYCGVKFDSTNMYTNSTAGVALSTGNETCETLSNGCLGQSGKYIGYGDQTSITRTFTMSDIGGHSYQNYFSVTPLGDTNVGLNAIGPITSFYVAGYPSLLVFAQSDANSGFYEKSGSYVKEIFFTLANKFPLELKINDYHLNCSGTGVTCQIDPSYNGFFVGASNGLMLIPATITVDKLQLPTSFSVSLDVNYGVPQFVNNAACTASATNATYTKPIIFSIGLLDKQDFQVELKASQDQGFCVGENGMIGQTGESFAPKINIGFGGTDKGDGLVSIDECDQKTVLADGSLVDNNTWVYCSQKELLVEVAKKVLMIGHLRESMLGATQPQKDVLLKEQGLYSTFTAAIRKQGFSQNELSSAIEEFSVLPFTNMGLNGNEYLGAYSATSLNDQIIYLGNLFDVIDFENATTLDAGTYQITIDINELTPFSASNYIFDGTTKQVNNNITIKIRMLPVAKPSFDWVFYNYGNTEITEGSIYKETLNTGDFHTTSDLERGITMKLIYDKTQTSADTNILYNTFAVPIIARVSDRNGAIDKNFSIERSMTNPPLFSYWTGFASTLGGGCETIENTIDPSMTALPYRQPDTRMNDLGASTFMFNFDFLDTVKKDQNMYLESVVFLPRGLSLGTEGLTLYAPFNVYTKNNVCAGTKNVPCVLDIDSSLSAYKIGNADSFASVLGSIQNGSMCVHKGINDDGDTQWTIFWNQAKILEDLAAQKAAITDATLCAAREILGG